MSDSLGLGSTFAGCRLETVAGRGGMGTVFRATQLALGRPVALKAIAPALAADVAFRERFQRTSYLAASIDHPNVIPVYEAGELDGTLYLIMRWVEGTDLRALLSTCGRLSPGRAVKLLRPVASAVAAGHARGLVHCDVKPANVLVAHEGQEEDDHAYLTDFGLARSANSESIQTVGLGRTVDYTAPERFQGGKGDAASDVYSFGCVLYEAVTGHLPYERPSVVSKIYAHAADPIPSARDEVSEVPEQLDAIIAKAMAKRPEDRFASARELAAALGEAMPAIDSTERAIATREPPEPTDAVAPTVATRTAFTQLEPATSHTEPGLASPLQESRVEEPPAPARTARRSPFIWLAPVVLLSLAGVLVATFSDVRSSSGTAAAALPSTTGTQVERVALQGGGMTIGPTISLGGVPGSVSIGRVNLWASLPDRGVLVRVNLQSGARSTFSARGRPTLLAAGSRALWVAQLALQSLAQFNGGSGTQVHSARLNGRPTAVALAQNDSTAWVADSSGAISHVGVGPRGIGTPAPVIGAPAHVDFVATSLAWGEGWLWASTGATNGLVRVSLGASGSSTAYRGGERPVAVALDQGVWIANANGHVTRFDPGQLRIEADIAIAPELDAVAATDPGPYVWALSDSLKTIYRVTNASNPAVTGSIAFDSLPVALAVSGHSLWVARQDGKITEIRF
jgi:serine/threonine protein kinase